MLQYITLFIEIYNGFDLDVLSAVRNRSAHTVPHTKIPRSCFRDDQAVGTKFLGLGKDFSFQSFFIPVSSNPLILSADDQNCLVGSFNLFPGLVDIQLTGIRGA